MSRPVCSGILRFHRCVFRCVFDSVILRATVIGIIYIWGVYMPKKIEWSVDQDAFVLRNVNILGIAETARQLGVGQETLKKHLTDLNISAVPVSLMIVADYNNDLLNGVASQSVKTWIAGVFDARGKISVGAQNSPTLRISGLALDVAQYVAEVTGMGKVGALVGGSTAYTLTAARDVLTFVKAISPFVVSEDLLRRCTSVEDYAACETQEDRDAEMKLLAKTSVTLVSGKAPWGDDRGGVTVSGSEDAG